MPRYVMVLNDGETYTDLTGCRIIRLPNDDFENMDVDGVDEFVKYVCKLTESHPSYEKSVAEKYVITEFK